ncbi:hypothetical protein M758_1G177900 [Ceratodon purpureus]|uniref:C2H2-type domain-containing protein n=1 Tax=Ceratodon purpureus TaxID=3225 RepID=A0A8T0J9D2_CERPU|nr:hypothetical protein KC19_1G180900 [Ceratodon purpureus]KAG0630435.1 hypothetical protein M758_1G177900 [Ceratodon purpureus]
MSRSVKQPIGQKRLTNVAIVRMRKHGHRFEIACFKNKVLSWRSRVEKDIDEVLQTHTVYENVSKGVLAKSKDMKQVFGTDDHDVVSLEILEKGELQVADRERESQLSNQFRDIATIVMAKTVNPETERPYTITMIERLMREVHFAVDPHRNSKQQALELIRELQNKYPIARARMRLRFVVPTNQTDQLSTSLNSWNSQIESREEMATTTSLVCKIEPGHFRECDSLVRELQGTLEVVSMAVQGEGESNIDDFNDDDDYNAAHVSHVVEDEERLAQRFSASVQDSRIVSDPAELRRISDTSSNAATTSKGSASADSGVKQQVCKTCNREVGDAKQYREHFKSDWHKHNLKRKMSGLPPLSAEECLADTDIDYGINDRDQYSR